MAAACEIPSSLQPPPSPPPLPPLSPLPRGTNLKVLRDFVRDGDLGPLRIAIERPEDATYWAEPHGRFLLRYLASDAAMAGHRDLVSYFVEVQGLPVHAREEEGLWKMPDLWKDA